MTKLFILILSFSIYSTTLMADYIFYNFNIDNQIFDGGEFGINKKKRKKRFKAGSSRNMYKKGVHFIAIGYGFPNASMPKMIATAKTFTIQSSADFYTEFKNRSFGVFHFRYEYALWNHFGLSFRSNFSNYDVSWVYNYTVYDNNGKKVITPIKSGYKGIALDLMARIDWHFYKTRKIDIYTGMGIGYSYNTSEYYSSDKSLAIDPNEDMPEFVFPIGVDGTTGIRYFFTDKISAYAEIGYSQSLIQIGATFRFYSKKKKL